jgi:hypothetical protein
MYGFEVLLAKEMIVAQLVNTAADVAERPDVLDCISAPDKTPAMTTSSSSAC